MWMWIAVLVLPFVMLGIYFAILYRSVLALWQRSLLLFVLVVIWMGVLLTSITLEPDVLVFLSGVMLPVCVLLAASSWWSEWMTVRKIKQDDELLKQAKGCRVFHYRPSRWGWHHSYIGRIREIEEA